MKKNVGFGIPFFFSSLKILIEKKERVTKEHVEKKKREEREKRRLKGKERKGKEKGNIKAYKYIYRCV